MDQVIELVPDEDGVFKPKIETKKAKPKQQRHDRRNRQDQQQYAPITIESPYNNKLYQLLDGFEVGMDIIDQVMRRFK